MSCSTAPTLSFACPNLTTAVNPWLNPSSTCPTRLVKKLSFDYRSDTSQRQFPDYYETIKHPMSLEMVKERLDKSQYNTLNDVCNDFGQIWNNAKRYNMRESLIFQWAKKMHKVTRDFYSSHTTDHDGSESEAEEPPQPTPQRKVPPTRTAVSTEAPSPAGPSTPMSETASSTPRPHGGPGTGKKRGSYMKDGPTVYKLIKPCMRAIKEARSDE